MAGVGGEEAVSIKIIDEPVLHLTADEYARYMDEYRKAFMFYAGTPPTFESWVVRQRASLKSRLETL